MGDPATGRALSGGNAGEGSRGAVLQPSRKEAPATPARRHAALK